MYRSLDISVIQTPKTPASVCSDMGINLTYIWMLIFSWWQLLVSCLINFTSLFYIFNCLPWLYSAHSTAVFFLIAVYSSFRCIFYSKWLILIKVVFVNVNRFFLKLLKISLLLIRSYWLFRSSPSRFIRNIFFSEVIFNGKYKRTKTTLLT